LDAVDGGGALLTDTTEAADGDLLVSFCEREKKEEVKRNNMRMAVSAVSHVSPLLTAATVPFDLLIKPFRLIIPAWIPTSGVLGLYSKAYETLAVPIGRSAWEHHS
jgi:hypothetical protein